ncbi:CRISPR-associated protein Cmr4 [Paenibacillus sp. CF095]|uniref:type III-B CRISPR module RAMP protein Cmr4 n=1 Tax=Paenibacillus sp. CF095 TaxID=1881033 RepID=UPI000887A8B0|nr:type III-B CRISPR module RAMP protein Cmr4 [Paenibacillus sp. CF095]SDE03718.1 CRISPR-associated protein Cmr4 [Paenibacillus sp. CF095]
MFTTFKPFLLYAVTSVHAGSGSEIGIVDLPIQREKHTAFPKIESSTLKGAWKRTVSGRIGESSEEIADFSKVFGSSPRDDEHNDSQASAVSFLDARILLFPIRSLRGTFAWVTCPYVVQRYNRELTMLNAANQEKIDSLILPVVEAGSVSGDALLINSAKGETSLSGSIVLEEYTFTVKSSEDTERLAEKLEAWIGTPNGSIGIRDRLVVLSDDEFTDFVQMSTEVNARIRVEDNGQVEGGLWYEENIPPETVFYSALLFGKPRESQKKPNRAGAELIKKSSLHTAEDVKRYVTQDHFPEVFQLGGSFTIGKGIMRNIRLEGGNENE